MPQGVTVSVIATGTPKKASSMRMDSEIMQAMRRSCTRFTIRAGSRFMSISWPMNE